MPSMSHFLSEGRPESTASVWRLKQRAFTFSGFSCPSCLCLQRCSWILEIIYIWGRQLYFSRTHHLDGQHSHQSKEVTLRSNT